MAFKKSSLEIVTGHIQKNAFLGQSQRRFSPVRQTTELRQTAARHSGWLT
jgi:hypothetical protein